MRRAAVTLAVMAATACGDTRTPIGGDWYTVHPARLPEAGFPPHSLARDLDGSLYVVATGVRDQRYYEPDCVVFRTDGGISIACGGAESVGITRDAVWSWNFEPDGLHMTTEPELVDGRVVETVRWYPIDELKRYATGEATGAPQRALVERTQTVDVRARGEDGRTPLLNAVYERRIDLVQALLRQGADPNVADDDGYTPLMAVAANVSRADMDRDVTMMTLLLDAGADPNQRDNAGRTARSRAEGLHSDELVRLLVDAGAT